MIVKVITFFIIASVQAHHQKQHSDEVFQRDLPLSGTCVSDASLLPIYSDAILAFGADLYKRILMSGNQWNFLFSPSSIAQGLALMQYAGHGTTSSEIHDQICPPDVPPEKDLAVARAGIESIRGQEILSQRRQFEIFGANALYVDKSANIDDDFKMIAMDCMKSLVANIDFMNDTERARQRINDWVSRRTNQKLNRTKDIFPEGTLPNDASIILVNALSMYGEWLNPFTYGREEPGRFYANNSPHGTPLPVLIMESTYRYTSQPDLHVLGIDYRNSELTFFLFTPKTTGNLSSIERLLDANQLSQLMDNTQDRRIALSIPKFELGYRLSLKNYLQQMGINEIFTNKADLSRLSDDDDLFLTDAVHAACFKFNENGTEPATMEGNSSVTRNASAGQPMNLVIDHPFLFLVRHNPSKLILLMGRMNNPFQKEQEEQMTTVPSASTETIPPTTLAETVPPTETVFSSTETVTPTETVFSTETVSPTETVSESLPLPTEPAPPIGPIPFETEPGQFRRTQKK